MLKAILLVTSIVIVFRDIQNHRIANQHLVLFTLISLCDMHRAGLIATLLSSSLIVVIFCLARIGMGDIKLALAIIVTQGSIVLSREFILYSALVLLATVLVRLLKYRHLQGSVAFSQVLLIPFLALYLAI